MLESVVAQVSAIRVGHRLADGTQMGPVVNRKQYEKSIHPSRPPSPQAPPSSPAAVVPPPGGLVVAPAVLGPMATDNPTTVEEIFGPVLSVLTFRDEAEAVAMANRTEYGLTADVFTSDLTGGHRMVAQLKVDYVWINGASRHYSGLPLGG